MKNGLKSGPVAPDQTQWGLIEEKLRTQIERCRSGCWVWIGPVTNSGFPRLLFPGGHSILAHRASYGFYIANLPPQARVIRRCGNRLCVHPEHLLLVTLDEFKRHCSASGVLGFRRSKLTPDQVREIRRRSRQGESNVNLAAAFGVTRTRIRQVVKGDGWRGVSFAESSPIPRKTLDSVDYCLSFDD